MCRVIFKKVEGKSFPPSTATLSKIFSTKQSNCTVRFYPMNSCDNLTVFPGLPENTVHERYAENPHDSRPRHQSLSPEPTGIKSVAIVGNEKGRQPKPGKPKTRSFLILSLLTASLFFCWVPLALLGTAAFLVKLDSRTVLRVLPYLNALANLQSIMDPVLFTIVMDDLRAAVFKCFGR